MSGGSALFLQPVGEGDAASCDPESGGLCALPGADPPRTRRPKAPQILKEYS